MKVVHTSDWHIGRTLGGYSLLEDQEYFLKQLAAFLVEQRADALIVAGDLYDRAVPSAQAVALLDRFLSDVVLQKKIPVLAIAGNHDSPERLSFSNQFLEQGGLYLQGTVKQGVKRVDLGPVHFYLLPYLEPAAVRQLFPDEDIRSFDQAVEAVARHFLYNQLNEEKNILISHGFWINQSNSPETSTEFSESERSVGGSDAVDLSRFSMFDYIALGHLHAPQQAAPNARYSGSPLKYSVSEAKQKKSVTLLDIGKNGIAVSAHTLAPLRDVRVVEGTLAEVVKSPSDDYVFVNLTDREYQLDAIGSLRGAFPHILGLQYVRIQYHNAASGAEAVLSKSPLELFGEFYQSSTGEQMQPEQKKLIGQLLDELGGLQHETSKP